MRFIHELTDEINVTPQPLDGCPVCLNHPNRVNILALGDVGTTMLIGLRLLGSDVISEIGICDIRQDNTARLEMEINQIGYPFTGWDTYNGIMNYLTFRIIEHSEYRFPESRLAVKETSCFLQVLQRNNIG